VKPTTDMDETVTCVSCLAQNAQSAPFCQQCGAPIGAMATVDPVQTIQTEGFLLRKALEGRPKPIVFLGLWILYLPMLLAGAGIAIYMIVNGRGLAAFVFFWAGMGLASFGFFVLYRATRNYLTKRKMP
jgi:hypothetical protein